MSVFYITAFVIALFRMNDKAGVIMGSLGLILVYFLAHQGDDYSEQMIALLRVDSHLLSCLLSDNTGTN